MIKAIIFDFDGTLIDTNALIKKALNIFSLKYKQGPLEDEIFNELTGKPLEYQMAHFDTDRIPELVEEFKEWYLVNHDQWAKPFDGILSLLSELRSQNYLLGIVTNNSCQGLDLGLKHMHLDNFFDVKITKDHVKESKPSPEGLMLALEKLKLSSSEVLFIGDTKHDILAARRGKILAGLVGWHQTPISIMPDFILHEPYDLLEILEELNTFTA